MRHSKDRFVTLCQQILAFGTVLAVAVPATSVVTLDIVGPADSDTATATGTRTPHQVSASGALVAAHPVDPIVRQYPVAAVGGSSTSRLRPVGARVAPQQRGGEPMVALSAPEPVSGYATVGVTWKHGVSIPDGGITVAVRTLHDGTWSGWTDVDYDAEHAPDPDTAEGRHARPGTDALLIGDVDRVQVSAYAANGSTPPDLQLAVIDPGATPGATREQPAIDTARLASADTTTDPGTTNPGSTDGTGAPTDPSTDPTTDPTDEPGTDSTGGTMGLVSGVTPKPRIFSRAQWGADERLRDKSSLHYFEVRAGFVHHTVNTNNYTRDQVPALLRGIYAYHTQSRGWSDIGYNFLVDRFGRIWEGRYGGVDRPVVGAHTLNYNEYSFAMSALGNYDKVRPSSAMLRAYGRLFAWKLSLHGVDPSSTRQWVGSRYFRAINGHRDAASTACPGKYLYAKLPLIRRLAAQDQAGWAARDRHTSLSGTRWPDSVVRESGTGRGLVVRTEGQVRFRGAASGSAGWAGRDVVAASPDLTGDGDSDLLVRNGDTGVSAIYPGDGAGGFGDGVRSTRRFSGMDQLAPTGDLNGDGHNDLLARARVTHKLFLFRGRDHRFAKRIAIAPDWRRYDLTVGTGDLDGDGRDDFVARDRDGKLWLFPNTGPASLGKPLALAGRWGGFDRLTGFSDYTGDGVADLVARNAGSRSTYIFPGTGSGPLRHWYGPFTAFRHADALTDVGDVTGDGSPDLAMRRGDQLLVIPATGGRNVGRVLDAHLDLSDSNLVLNVGDWNNDGRGDLITRTPAGRLMFRAGLAHNRFADPVVAATGFDDVQLLTAVGDMTGDGHPDLMGQPKGHAMRIYPGNGSRGLRASYVAHSAIGAGVQAGGGLWNGDGAPDSLFKSGRALVLFAGNGPGGLMSGKKIASGMRKYDWVLGAGDVDGDGHSDLVARGRTSGYLWLLPGHRAGIGTRHFLGEGFGGYNLAG